jgi:hypothetical protein
MNDEAKKVSMRLSLILFATLQKFILFIHFTKIKEIIIGFKNNCLKKNILNELVNKNECRMSAGCQHRGIVKEGMVCSLTRSTV